MLTILFSRLSFSSMKCGEVDCNIEGGVLKLTSKGLFKTDAAYSNFHTLTIPQGVTIDAESFKEAKELRTLTLENDATIKSDSFTGITQLTSLTIGGTCSFLNDASNKPFNNMVVEELRLTSSKIENLPANIFASTHNTKTFELSAGNVPLTKDSFAGLKTVSRLIIGGKTSFDQINKENILQVMASTLVEVTIKDEVKGIPADFLQNLQQLLKLYYGPAEGEFSSDTIRASTKLQSLSFSGGAKIKSPTSFTGFPELTDVSFFKAITIPKDTFKGCGLESISFQDNGIVVETGAFVDNKYLEIVHLPATATYVTGSASRSIKEETRMKIYQGAFNGATVKTINMYYTLDNSAVTLPISKVFGANVDTIIISEGVKQVNAPTFDGLNEIKVGAPKTLTEIPPTLFTNCNSVEVGFREGNPNIEISQDGAIYSKDGKKLMAVYPQATKVEVKHGVVDIGEDVFKNHKNLAEVTIPATVKTIGNNGFTGCTSLKTFVYQSDAIIENNIFDPNSGVKISVTENYKGDSFGGKKISDHDAKPDSSTNPDDNPKKPNKTGIIVGSVVGVLVVVVAVVGVTIFIIKRRKD